MYVFFTLISLHHSLHHCLLVCRTSSKQSSSLNNDVRYLDARLKTVLSRRKPRNSLKLPDLSREAVTQLELILNWTSVLINYHIYRVFTKYCVFFLKCCDLSELLSYLRLTKLPPSPGPVRKHLHQGINCIQTCKLTDTTRVENNF